MKNVMKFLNMLMLHNVSLLILIALYNVSRETLESVGVYEEKVTNVMTCTGKSFEIT